MEIKFVMEIKYYVNARKVRRKVKLKVQFKYLKDLQYIRISNCP